ncbi:hypothetical protein Tco_0459315 [Tanacetum coccineum]
MVRCPSCKAQSIIRTSWTSVNPGRRFYCCPGTHGIIDWYDDPMCPRAVQIIPGLLRNINTLQASYEDLQSKMFEQANETRKWKWILAISWFVFVGYFIK